MVSQNEVDADWGALAEADAATREPKMLQRYEELFALSEDERRNRLRAMANAEYALPDEKLRPFTVSRMRTWIALPAGQAEVIAASYDKMMQGMPGPVAMRRVGMVQSLVSEFTAEEEARLRELVPTLFAGAPGRRTGLDEAPPVHQMSRLEAKAEKDARKPFWKFW